MTRNSQLAAVLISFLATASALADVPDLVAGVNDVQFTSAPEQTFLGSGFVLKHKGRLYGVTAKHVLLMRSSGPPASTDVQAALDHWRLRDPRSGSTLEFGRLLNGDANEVVDESVLARDVLLFELSDAGPFKPLQLAKRDPKPGERLRAIGCSYARASECAQDTYVGHYLEHKAPNLLIDLGEQKSEALFGLSGAPVLNEAGDVVGLVSNELPDRSGTQRFAPVDTAYLRELLEAAAPRQESSVRGAGQSASQSQDMRNP